MPEVVVERARLTDAEEIVEVFYRAWLATYPNKEARITVDDVEDRFKNRDARIAKIRRQISSQSDIDVMLVAKIQGKVIGVARAQRGERNQLKAIYVLPAYQRHGIGKKLWAEAKGFFDATRDTFVHTATYNNRAISFYNALGFERTGKSIMEERLRMKSGVILPQTEMIRKAELP